MEEGCQHRMRIAITGSQGFIGHHLKEKLRSLGLTVLTLDLQNGKDITCWERIKDTGKFDTLFHLAAKTFVPDSFDYPRQFYETNVKGLLNILELCRKKKARLIFISSYVYGIPEYFPIDETHPLKASNPYMHSKIMGEFLCRSFHQHYGIPIIIIRPSNIYGKGQKRKFLIPSILDQAKRGQIVLDDPKPRRDFLYVSDLVEALVRLIEIDGVFEIFNIGSGRSYSIRTIARKINTLMKMEVPISFSMKTRPHEIQDTVYDIEKARKKLGWSPRISLDEGLKSLTGFDNSRKHQRS